MAIFDTESNEEQKELKRLGTWMLVARIILFVMVSLGVLATVAWMGTSSVRQIVSSAVLLALTMSSYKKPYISFLAITIMYVLEDVYNLWTGYALYKVLPVAFIFGLVINLSIFFLFVVMTGKAKRYELLKQALENSNSAIED